MYSAERSSASGCETLCSSLATPVTCALRFSASARPCASSGGSGPRWVAPGVDVTYHTANQTTATRIVATMSTERPRPPGGFMELEGDLLGPVLDVALQHAILEILLLEHRLRDIAERHDADQPVALHDREIARARVDHGAPQVVHFHARARDHRIALHDLRDPRFAERAVPLVERDQDLPKRQDADHAAFVHHHQGTHVVLGHHRHGLGQLPLGRDREEGVAFHLEDFAYLHVIPLSPRGDNTPAYRGVPHAQSGMVRSAEAQEESMRFDWSKLGRTAPAALSVARNLAHHAVQWPAKAARANLKAVPDDSHSAFSWDASHAALLTQGLPAKGGEVRAGIRVPRLELIITRGDNVLDAFQLHGRTDAQAGAWIDTKLRVLGLKPAGDLRLPYELTTHPLGDKPHDLAMLGRELGELARWFGGSAEALEEFTGKLSGPR